MGHACPIVCTLGLIRALQARGSDELKAAYLPPLLDRDYDRKQTASQFLTEVQGGSDVGANAVEARPAGGDGRRLAAARREMVLLGGQRRPDAGHGAANGRSRGHARAGHVSGAPPPARWLAEPLPHPPPEDQVRHPHHGLGRDRLRRRRGLSHRRAWTRASRSWSSWC